MAKIQKPNVSPSTPLALRLDEAAMVPVLFANSYNVIFENQMIRVNFACLSGGQLLKGATVFLPEDMIFSNKESTVEYFSQMAEITPDEPTPFVPEKLDVYFGQLFAFSRHGTMSETNPVFIRLNLLANAKKEVRGTPIVSINMPISAQLGIVKAIYIDDWPRQKA